MDGCGCGKRREDVWKWCKKHRVVLFVLALAIVFIIKMLKN